MMISDYLTFTLTNQAAGDLGTVSLLGLLDLQRKTWWDAATELLDLSPSLLSAPVPPGTQVGLVERDGAQQLGLPTGIQFVAGSLDHHVAAIGGGMGQVADFSESIGTVLACLHYTRGYHPKANCCMGPGLCGYDYYQLACDDNGAAALEWYQKEHARSMSIRDLDRLAESIEVGSEGLIARPRADRYGGLEGFRNISPAHRPGHFARALMESTAATLHGLVETLYGEGRPERIVATGGGARSDAWLQIKADLLGVEFVRTRCHEPACIGAALLASVAAGWFDDLEQASSAWISVERVFQPDPRRSQAYSEWLPHYHDEIAP